MTEAELLDLYFQIENSNFILLAALVSVIAALYTLAYMVGTNLQIPSLTFVIVTYCLIIAFIALINNGYLVLQGGVIESLRDLESEGAQLSHPSEMLMDRWTVDSSVTKILLPFQFLLLLFPIGGVVYLIHQYRKSSVLEEIE